ncbi:MAG TPA: M20/M25/M40 family metallo-hydrolase [Candidatus Sulfotelmatobacter sp.]|nr:M20/M25/M40 family metallo-hydrolase [Candidatus Sulfotelmatobacter sp.]
MFESINTPTGPNWKLRAVAAVAVVGLGAGAVSIWRMTQMPLRSYGGNLPPLSAAQMELSSRLRDHVSYLSATIRERNSHFEGSLPQTIDYLRNQLGQMGYAVVEQTYTVGGQPLSNLEAQLIGSDNTAGQVVIGAHYDNVEGTVGADDNASGVAAALELARLLRTSKLRRTVRFVFFVNEEPPYFQTEQMGSLVYARNLRRDGVRVEAMISLETIGFYSAAPGSQKYPPGLNLFYPSRGDFVAFVGNPESRDLLRRAVRTFRESAQFPSEGIAAPASWPGIGWSDHWSFWQEGYPAIMITDTAPFRYPYYHTALDTVDKIDFEKMARVVDGMRNVVASLADER